MLLSRSHTAEFLTHKLFIIFVDTKAASNL